ncbi:MAG: hypothetical protein E6I55_00665 [Chloroflexi bacterium]|nr:MAG: hypothetical protein E6I55_00665 [Chloroflexota bacterium]
MSLPVGVGRSAGALRRLRLGDRAYRRALQALGLVVLGIFAAVGVSLFVQAWPALVHSGPGFVTGTTWDPNKAIYGVLPFIVGTLLTSAIALVLAIPIGIGAAIFLSEYAPRRIAAPLGVLVELLAAVPSVVYGLWGLLVLAPIFVSTVEPPLTQLPFARGPALGVGLLLAGVILAVMILPTITAVTRDLMSSVPAATRSEASCSRSGGPWERRWRSRSSSATATRYHGLCSRRRRRWRRSSQTSSPRRLSRSTRRRCSPRPSSCS